VVEYLGEDFRFLKLLQAQPPTDRTTMSLAELEAARGEAAAVVVRGEVLRAVADLRRELGRRSVVASDRRWTQSIGVLRAHAWLDGRDAVGDGDVAFLEHVLWRDPAERQTVREVIRELLHGYEDEVRVLLYQSRELRDYALREWDEPRLRNRAAVEAHTKLRSVLHKHNAIQPAARSRRAGAAGRSTRASPGPPSRAARGRSGRRPCPPTMARNILLPPRQHCWIESDAFDRSTFAALVAETPSLAALLERGAALVPHARELLEDLFCLLYKLEPRWRSAEEVAGAAALNRELLAGLRDHPLLESVRGESQLDEVKAGLGALLLGEHIFGLLREERLLTRGDLLDLWDLDRQEDELRRRGEELADLE